MKITIVGGGNIGTQFAVHCAEKGHDVIIYTSEPNVFKKHLAIVDENDRTIHEGDISLATNNPGIAFGEAELIIVTVPSMIMKKTADIISEYITPNAIIGAVPGSGGAECAFMKCIERGNTFWGLERVPAVARLVTKGEIVKSVGYREELHVCAIPCDKTKECCRVIESIFDIPCVAISNYLNITLTPSNPVLHTARLKVLFSDWVSGTIYDSVPLFYQDWDDESSELLLKCDDEVQRICKAFPDLDLSHVISLRIHYESATAREMTNKISGIKAFQGIKTPMVQKNGKYIPDLNSRYFVADFSYGLDIIKQVAVFGDVDTPNIDGILDWYYKIAIVNEKFNYSDYGIFDRNSFEMFYKR